MKGLDWNGGFVAWVGRVAESDAHILEILWRAGAVFYVRSTQPQSLMHLETSSNLYGYGEKGRKGSGLGGLGLIELQYHHESFQ
jgi:Asp-tRNA(Asn)/Glu-tRNA(Gln) amidotransferase A subunit family amidase